MSVSLYAWTERCDHRPCCGDCDLCGYSDEDEKEEDVLECPTLNLI